MTEEEINVTSSVIGFCDSTLHLHPVYNNPWYFVTQAGPVAQSVEPWTPSVWWEHTPRLEKFGVRGVTGAQSLCAC